MKKQQRFLSIILRYKRDSTVSNRLLTAVLVVTLLFESIAPVLVFAKQAPVQSASESTSPTLVVTEAPQPENFPTPPIAQTANPANNETLPSATVIPPDDATSILERPTLPASATSAPVPQSDALVPVPSSDEKETEKDKPNSDPSSQPGNKNEKDGAGGAYNKYDTSNFVYQKTILPGTDPSSGSLTYAYPIATPSGRAGMEPSLKISYNSSDNSNINIIGYGWELNIPSIERINRQGNLVAYEQDYFNSSLSGELASTTVNGIYVSRVDSGDFLKYTYSTTTTSWKVYDKHGTVYTFGADASSRNADPSNASKVAKWYLSEARDANGNFISYSYTVAGGQVYPSQITYTNFKSDSGEVLPGIYKVDFTYDETRLDKTLPSYKLVFLSTNAKRLKSIEVKVNEVVSRKYELVYDVGVNGVRSLLKSITETGFDSQGVVVTLPSTTFDYTKGFENPVLPVGLEPAISSGGFTWALGSFYYGPWRKGQIYADLNGDGYTDSFHSLVSPGDNNFYSSYTMNKLGSPRGVTLPKLVFNETSGGEFPVDRGNRIFDINGDGFLDFAGIPPNISCDRNCPPPPQEGIFINDNSDNTLNNHNYIATTTGGYYSGPRSFVADFYGDGLPNTHGWSPTGVGAMDINGDGLDDMKTSDRYSSSRLSTGGPEGPAIPIFGDSPDHSLMELDGWGNDMGVRYLDINADGLVDVLRGWILPADPNLEHVDNGYTKGDYNEVYINTGKTFVKSATLKSPYFIKINPGNQKWFFTYQMTDYYDTNGDGIVDIPEGPTTKTDILKTITHPLGGTTAIEYKPSTQYKRPNGSLMNPRLPNILWTVSAIKTSDGLGNPPQIETYTYENGRGVWNSPYDRKFAGFGKVTKTTNSAVIATYYHQGNGDSISYGEIGDSYGKISHPYKIEIFDRDGTLFARTQNIYNETPLIGVNSPGGFASSSPVFVYLSKKIDESFDGGQTHRDRASEYTYNTTNGNLLSSVDYGEVVSGSTSSVSSPTFNDTSNDKVTASFEYASNLTGTNSPFGQVRYAISRKILTSQNETLVSESKIYFDNLPFGEMSQGNQTKQESLIGADRYAVTSATYNSFGLTASSTDANGNTTGYVYDTHNLYPTFITNPLQQTTLYEYDYSIGKPKKITDANNQAYTKTYDAFGRILEEKQPDGNANVSSGTPAPLLTKTTYQYVDTPNSVAVKRTDFIDNTLSKETYVYFDGLGREIQTRKQSENTEIFAMLDTVYNSDGQVAKQSLPYFSNGLNRTPATTDDALYTNFAYDPLGRNIRKIDARGTTKTVFNLGKTTVTDALGNSKIYYKDVFDWLVRVDEFNYPETYSTNYEYDPIGNLVKITDALGNVRNFRYDLLARRLTAEDLHTPSDSTFGLYGYQYDDVGNLTQKTDPNGNKISYTYDALNRLKKTEVISGSTSPKITATYFYDSCGFGVGKLCSVTYPDDPVSNAVTNTTSYRYNPAGQMKTEIKNINGKSFVSGYIYNLDGNVTEMIGQDGNKTIYKYNRAGLLDSVGLEQTTVTPRQTAVIVSNFDYSPLGQLTTTSFGNGSVTTNTYDSTKLYRLTNKKTLSATGKKLQDLNYSYDSVGNILQIADNSDTNAKKISSYTYDDLYRLTIASTTPYQQSFAYNAVGNMMSKTDGAVNQPDNYALNFDRNASQYSYVPDNLGIRGDAVTIELWFKPNRTPGDGTPNVFSLFSLGDSGTRVKYLLWYWTEGGVTQISAFRIGTTGATLRSDYNVTLDTNTWYHIVYTYDTSVQRLYIATAGGSHTLRDSDAGYGNSGSREVDHFSIGASLEPDGRYIGFADGKIDDVRVWNTLRTVEELDDNFQTGLKTESDDFRKHLVGYYTLDNNYNDKTVNGHHLIAVSDPTFTSDAPFTAPPTTRPAGIVTTYLYGGTGYTNPHAPVLIGNGLATSTLSYDKNGNLISYGKTVYKYNYDNRLISTGDGIATSTYAYDFSGARIKVSEGNGRVTLYPSKYYNAEYDGGNNFIKRISHVFAGDTTLATLEKKYLVTPESSVCPAPQKGDVNSQKKCLENKSITPASPDFRSTNKSSVATSTIATSTKKVSPAKPSNSSSY